MRYLVEKGGLDSAKLTAVGYGSTRPVASNATEEGRKRNRRIEIVLYTTGASESVKEIGEASVSMPVKPFTATVEPAKIFVPVPAGGVAENQSGQAAPPIELVQPIGEDKSDGHPVMTPVQ
jgi:hypothetical protein